MQYTLARRFVRRRLGPGQRPQLALMIDPEARLEAFDLHDLVERVVPDEALGRRLHVDRGRQRIDPLAGNQHVLLLRIRLRALAVGAAFRTVGIRSTVPARGPTADAGQRAGAAGAFRTDAFGMHDAGGARGWSAFAVPGDGLAGVGINLGDVAGPVFAQTAGAPGVVGAGPARLRAAYADSCATGEAGAVGVRRAVASRVRATGTLAAIARAIRAADGAGAVGVRGTAPAVTGSAPADQLLVVSVVHEVVLDPLRHTLPDYRVHPHPPEVTVPRFVPRAVGKFDALPDQHVGLSQVRRQLPRVVIPRRKGPLDLANRGNQSGMFVVGIPAGGVFVVAGMSAPVIDLGRGVVGIIPRTPAGGDHDGVVIGPARIVGRGPPGVVVDHPVRPIHVGDPRRSRHVPPNFQQPPFRARLQHVNGEDLPGAQLCAVVKLHRVGLAGV